MTYIIELLCLDCQGKGCEKCKQTGAVEHEVDAATFYGALQA
jgi:hypothetical protein